ncbi:receptor-interacting serine/threonine-protein kinase 3-like isoform X2 [Lithobates pipiens]
MQLLPPGDLERLTLVGNGGFGNVYRGESRKLSMKVALKVVKDGCGSNLEKLMKDLMKERDVMQKASNPYVLGLLGVYKKEEGSLLEHGLVMEYMPYNLRTLFDNIPDVPWALRTQILHQVVLGMNYLHSLDPPIIHRDLKPSNVLLNKHLDVKITDFGLSKIIGAPLSTEPSLAGTVSYIPPEAINNLNHQLSKSYDVYSFGILVWTVLSGKEPHSGTISVLIMLRVTDGQRPTLSVLDKYNDVKMVPKAKELMVRCWDHNADNRPSFHDCSEYTSVMCEDYQNEVKSAVRSVEDRLTNTNSSEQQAEPDLNAISTEMAAYLEDNVESQQLDLKAVGEDPKHPTVLETVGDTNKNKEGDFWDKLVDVVKNSGGYTKITGQLNNEGVLSEEDQQKLNSSQNAKDFSDAAKAFGEKLTKKPEHVLPVLKAIFKI